MRNWVVDGTGVKRRESWVEGNDRQESSPGYKPSRWKDSRVAIAAWSSLPGRPPAATNERILRVGIFSIREDCTNVKVFENNLSDAINRTSWLISIMISNGCLHSCISDKFATDDIESYLEGRFISSQVVARVEEMIQAFQECILYSPAYL